MRPGWASSEPRGRWCAPGRPDSPSRHPPPSSGRPLFSRLPHPTGGSANDEASSRIHLRSPVRPSPACGPPGGTGALGPFPRASHPAVTRSARRGGDGPCALDRELRHRHQPISLRRAPLITCDLMSHDPVQPGGVARQKDEFDVVRGSPACYFCVLVWREAVHDHVEFLARPAAAQQLEERQQLTPALAGPDPVDELAGGQI